MSGKKTRHRLDQKVRVRNLFDINKFRPKKNSRIRIKNKKEYRKSRTQANCVDDGFFYR